MIYQLREDKYDDDELDEMSDEDMAILLADCNAEIAHVERVIKEKQHEFKNGKGPGLRASEFVQKELDVARAKELKYQIEYLLLQ